jgi:tRNA1(Val) A37 N6-methylase TrmN6
MNKQQIISENSGVIGYFVIMLAQMNLKKPEDEYDLIVSNPPFYTEDYKTDNEQRDLATRRRCL